MKYNKEFRQTVERYSIPSRYVMPYDQWKRCMKHPTLSFLWNWKRNLYLQCDRLDHALFSKASPLCQGGDCSLDSEDLLRACELNQKTLYKTCKKLDKQVLHSSEAKEWFRWLMKHKRYKFMGCQELTLVKLSIDPQECPICLETLHDSNVCFGRCQHMVCRLCLEKMQDSMRCLRCPLCRVAW